jgi:potassium-transporting ATPase KdpC subunit
MFQQIAPALRMTVLLTVLTGLIYPFLVTGVCQALFKDKANGSLVVRNGQVIGSSLIAQNFIRPEYFHPRPSAAGNDGYDSTASSPSNFGPTNQKLYDRVKAAADQFRKENPAYSGPIPADALTASGSGLDPEISIANAHAQAERVAHSRNISLAHVESIIASATHGRDLGFLGEPRVNVLALNLELDRQLPLRASTTR